MDKRLVLVLKWTWVSQILSDPKVQARCWFPLGPFASWLGEKADVLARFRTCEGYLNLDPSAKVLRHKGNYYLQSHALIKHLPSLDKHVEHVFMVVEGSEDRARVVVHFDDGGLIRRLEEDDPALRVQAYDLPPISATLIDTSVIVKEICRALRQDDQELHSRRTDDFVHHPHILLALFSHVMELRSKDQIDFVSSLRCIADQLRELLKHRIVKIEKSHQRLWSEWYGSRISFIDGGMARIVGLPDAEPVAIRVGVYTVTPGETDVDNRENWRLYPYVAGDIINTPADPDDEFAGPPDRKRYQEAARYILEALTVLRHVVEGGQPDIVLLHGPLVNSFTMYDEGEPHYIPAVDPSFLESCGITEQAIIETITDIPRRRDGCRLWNQCMALYGYLMKRVFDLDIPVVGVVERSGSTSFGRTMIEYLKREQLILESYARTLRQLLEHYRIADELLFGCVLDEGEYIEPVVFQKNVVRRAREAWQPVVSQYPNPVATYLKTSPSSFPYRIEMNQIEGAQSVKRAMDLMYHTSRLLPEYAFPVGLDIADKYAKVPDWLSKGVSAAIAAQVLAKAVTTGQPRILQQVRNLLARSPRDFYFRPHA